MKNFLYCDKSEAVRRIAPSLNEALFFVRGITNLNFIVIVGLFARICSSQGGKRASLVMWVESAHGLFIANILAIFRSAR